MKRLLFLAFALAAVAALPAGAQQLRGPGAMQALVAPVAGYPDNVIVDIAAAAGDPRLIGSLADPWLRSYLLEHSDWARDFWYAYQMQPGELWQEIDAERQARGGYPPVAGIVAAPVYVQVVQPAFFVVHRQPGRGASSAPPSPGLPAGVAPAFVHGQALARGPAFVNGPPSRAAQLQAAQSAAFVARARAASQPSPALRTQEAQWHQAERQRREQGRR